jgi:glycosyltransferase involved in cell wall biosynthesis
MIPDLLGADLRDRAIQFVKRHPRVQHLPGLKKALVHFGLYTKTTYGGTLNIMRHCALARSLGVDAALVTPSGKDTYGRFNVVDVPFVRWSEIRGNDLCLVPDFCTDLVSQLAGPVIVYLQIPTLLFPNFDYLHPRVRLWTDSPFMLEKCRAVFPGKEIAIVPNIIDPKTFPFRPQSEREPGLLFAFPRKGPEFIEATAKAYAALGGTYWRVEMVHGLTLLELAKQMQRPQAFLASADVEGCALPPQESMACGIVVVGKNARGANFSMEHRKTAMVAETPEAAAVCLREIEDSNLRDDIARRAHSFVSRYFPEGEPKELWCTTLREFGVSVA